MNIIRVIALGWKARSILEQKIMKTKTDTSGIDFNSLESQALRVAIQQQNRNALHKEGGV